MKTINKSELYKILKWEDNTKKKKNWRRKIKVIGHLLSAVWTKPMEEQTAVVGRRWLSSLRRSEADRGERRVLAHHWPTTGPLRAPPGRWQTIRGSWCRRLVCPGSAAVCEITRDCARLPRAEVVWRATGALFVTTDTQPPNNGPQVCKLTKNHNIRIYFSFHLSTAVRGTHNFMFTSLSTFVYI